MQSLCHISFHNPHIQSEKRGNPIQQNIQIQVMTNFTYFRLTSRFSAGFRLMFECLKKRLMSSAIPGS